jgi:poly [ADP-ribose] polymerase
MAKVVKLMMVTQENNNKFYNMTDLENGYWLVEYGRVGASSQKKEYPIDTWTQKLNEKLRKGYTDISPALTVAVKATGEDFSDVKDARVKDLLCELLDASNKSIASNYSVGVKDITKDQLNTAQGLLGSLLDLVNKEASSDAINTKLELLYRVIPRVMKNTKDYFLRAGYKKPYALELLQSEQSRFDTLSNAVQNVHRESFSLASLGLKVEVASQEDRDLIASKTDFRVGKQKIFKVVNEATESAYIGGKSRLLYHGSRTSNFLSILQNGLKIKPQGVPTAGSMFGNAIYFANRAAKSLGYTSLRGSRWAGGSASKGYLAIFEVATGKEWKVMGKAKTWQSWMSQLDAGRVKSEGCDSVYAEGGADLRNDEYMVYNSNQCTIRYLIEVTE